MIVADDLDRLLRYMRALADVMGLRDWTYRAPDERPKDPDALAAITCTYGQKVGSVRVCEEFFGGSAEDIRMAMVHELIHCHLDGIDTAARSISQVVSPGEFKLHEDALKDSIEWACDGITRAWMLMLPLPTFGKEDDDAPHPQAGD